MGGCCKEVYRFPHNINYPYSTCISSFLQQHPYFFVHFENVFSFLFRLFLSNIANAIDVAQRTFDVVQKSRSREHGDIIISTRKYVDCVRERESRDVHITHRPSSPVATTYSVLTGVSSLCYPAASYQVQR